ncbi:MAG TPA: TMEM165/GDT1 family protein [Clostridia bacterium]|nr:TMEM165/GDT1 family protein [Clostridia bacterium]
MSFSEFIVPFVASVGFVTLNEMGDKTQLLAMAFATRFKFWKVMLGVLIATILNHGLAVFVGAMLARIPGWQGWVRFIAAALFILFGLWALVSDQLDGDDSGKKTGNEVATVAIAFFFAEMGDKTQLATITLSAQYYGSPLLVLAGTTTGMLLADGLGILIGVVLHQRLPAKALKVMASGAFILFGLVGIWQSLTGTFKFDNNLAATIVSVVALLSIVIGTFLYRKDSKKREV